MFIIIYLKYVDYIEVAQNIYLASDIVHYAFIMLTKHFKIFQYWQYALQNV